MMGLLTFLRETEIHIISKHGKSESRRTGKLWENTNIPKA